MRHNTKIYPEIYSSHGMYHSLSGIMNGTTYLLVLQLNSYINK
jgi:hypothetical protein